MLHYPIPWKLVFSLGFSVIFLRRRSFQKDSQESIARLPFPVEILGSENIPQSGGCLLTVNHYARPGFPAWWLALSISAVTPIDIHWIMTSEWTYPDFIRTNSLTPISRWLFSRIAQVYGFTSMPPMPPRPADVVERAAAVRRVLKFVRQSPDSVIIGLAPEGGDFAEKGKMAAPPPGVGRFIDKLAQSGLRIVPVGFFEQKHQLCLAFGQPYMLDIPTKLNTFDLDARVSKLVMDRIGTMLPG